MAFSLRQIQEIESIFQRLNEKDLNWRIVQAIPSLLEPNTLYFHQVSINPKKYDIYHTDKDGDLAKLDVYNQKKIDEFILSTNIKVEDIRLAVISGNRGFIYTNTPVPSEGWAIGTYEAGNSGAYDNIGMGNIDLTDKIVRFFYNGTTWTKSETIVATQYSNNLDSTSKSKGETGNSVFNFVKDELNTQNLFNKNTFKSGYAFNTATGEVIISNNVNGISDLIPVEPNTWYGMSSKANSLNKNHTITSNGITAIYIVEYNGNKELVKFYNIQDSKQLKTDSTTKFIRINPNSIDGFEKWKELIVFAKIEKFPFGYVSYNTQEELFHNDLSFYKKQEPITVITDNILNYDNGILTFPSGNNNLYNKTIFEFKYGILYTGKAVMVIKLKGNLKKILPHLLWETNLIFNTTKGYNPNLQPSIYFRKGIVEDEYFIIAQGNFDQNDGVSFVKTGRTNFTLEEPVSFKIECSVLYLDETGKPREVGNVTAEQLEEVSESIDVKVNQAIISQTPAIISSQIGVQVPAMIEQQIGAGLNQYLIQHINDFDFNQPNYINANSDFDFSSLTPAMSGMFISVIEDIDLQGATVNLLNLGVKDLKIVFNGGRILNGKIRPNFTHCVFNSNAAFVNVEILGKFQNEYALPEWFGAKIDGQDGGIGNFTKDDSFSVNQALNFASTVKLVGDRTMIIKKPIVMRTGNTIEADKNFEIKLGDGANCTLLKNEHIDIPHDALNPIVYPQGFKRNKNITIRGGIWNGNGLKQNRADNPAVGDQPDVVGTQRFPDGDTLDFVGFMMKFADIDNFLMEDLTLKDGRTYLVAAGGLTTYIFRNIQMVRRYHIENGDGIHLHGHCYNGVFENISGQAGDDMIAVTTTEASRLSIRLGDVIGLKVRNIYNYGNVPGSSYANPQEVLDGVPPMTKTTRCLRLTYTDHIIDDVTVENVRGYSGKFLSEVLMAYLHMTGFTGTNGKIGSVVVKGVKNNNGCSPISVGANTKIDHITLRDSYINWETTDEYPALVKMTDNFGAPDQWALTRIGTVVIDNVYFLKGNTLYDAPHGLVWMMGKIKNLFINNLVIEDKSGSTSIDSLLSGNVDFVSLTNSKLSLKRIFSLNGYASEQVEFKEHNNEFTSTDGKTQIGIVPKRVVSESLIVPTNPTNPKEGDKILKTDGLYLYTNAWNKL